MLFLFPVLQVLCLALTPKNNKAVIGQWATALCWVTLVAACAIETFVIVEGEINFQPFIYDRLSGALSVLITLISLLVSRFSVNYLQLDKNYKDYFIKLSILAAVLLLFVSAANIWLLALSWTGMSIGMLQLIGHLQTVESKKTVNFVQAILFMGDIFFWLGAILWVKQTHSANINVGLSQILHSPIAIVVASLWLIAGLTKSCNIPFSRWLPVTMTAPTPVSAMMHAGFVNAGGILFARFAALYIQSPGLLMLMFCIGTITATYGALKMMVQTDIKRNLAYSTIGQMGFMVLQCGLGAFSIAMFHVIAHSLFKSSLFLGSGSIIQDAQGVYLPNETAKKETLSPILKKVILFILLVAPLGVFILFSPHFQPADAANLLWFYPILTLVPLFKNAFSKRLQVGVTALFGVVLLLLYYSSKLIAHAIFMPTLLDLSVKLLPWHGVIILLSGVCLAFAVLGSGYPSHLSNWLYVQLLNQQTIFTHRPKKNTVS